MRILLAVVRGGSSHKAHSHRSGDPQLSVSYAMTAMATACADGMFFLCVCLICLEVQLVQAGLGRRMLFLWLRTTCAPKSVARSSDALRDSAAVYHNLIHSHCLHLSLQSPPTEIHKQRLRFCSKLPLTICIETVLLYSACLSSA